MSAAMRYTPGTVREVVAERVGEAEAHALLLSRPARSGEVLVAEAVPGEPALRTVVALTPGERCSHCGRAGR